MAGIDLLKRTFQSRNQQRVDGLISPNIVLYYSIDNLQWNILIIISETNPLFF